jgi:hypothetical protein
MVYNKSPFSLHSCTELKTGLNRREKEQTQKTAHPAISQLAMLNLMPTP